MGTTITDKIKTYEDACAHLGLTPSKADKTIKDDKIRRSALAFVKLATIAKALNDGWEPDWSNTDEYKYYPWFYVENAGLVYAYTYYSVTSTYAFIGSRLGYKTRELARYAGNQFLELYSEMLL